MKMAKSVEEYIEDHGDWESELFILRKVLSESGMQETLKWGAPVYTVDGKNVAGIGAFKSYVGVWFFQGVFLSDPASKLINAQDGKTKALRQWRFNSLEELKTDLDLLTSYIDEAIENQRAGKEMKPEKKELIIPPELQSELDEDPLLKECFDSLSLSLKREYADHITEAKREATKSRRLEKIKPMILQKIGLNDKYR